MVVVAHKGRVMVLHVLSIMQEAVGRMAMLAVRVTNRVAITVVEQVVMVAQTMGEPRVKVVQVQ